MSNFEICAGFIIMWLNGLVVGWVIAHCSHKPKPQGWEKQMSDNLERTGKI